MTEFKKDAIVILHTTGDNKPLGADGQPTIEAMRSYLNLYCIRACLAKYPSIHDPKPKMDGQ